LPSGDRPADSSSADTSVIHLDLELEESTGDGADTEEMAVHSPALPSTVGLLTKDLARELIADGEPTSPSPIPTPRGSAFQPATVPPRTRPTRRPHRPALVYVGLSLAALVLAAMLGGLMALFLGNSG
jgi:hypothetical protein